MRCIARGITLRVLYCTWGSEFHYWSCELLLGFGVGTLIPHVSSTSKALGPVFLRRAFIAFLERTVLRARAWNSLFEEGLRSSGEESRLPCGCESLPGL
jgi:hypothetical protein